MKPFLAHCRPLDVDANARVDIYAGDSGCAAELGTGGINYEPVVIDRASLSMELMSPDMDGSIRVGQASFQLNLSAVRAVTNAARLYWQGAPVTIQATGVLEGSTANADFDGIVTSAQIDRETGALSVTALVNVAQLSVSLLTKAFTGSGGLGGDVAKTGTLLPAGFGICHNVPPVWFDLTYNIGMLDGYGNLQSVQWLGEGLSGFGPAQGDYPNYAALKAAIIAGTVAPGQWATSIADGLIGLGAPAQGVITCHATFGYATPAALLLQLLQNFTSVDHARIDTAAFTALNTALSGLLGHVPPVHYWTADQRQVLDLLQTIAASCNATMLATLQGKFSVSRAVTTAAVGTLDLQGQQAPLVLASANISQDPPFAQIQARAARPALVMTNEQVNFVDTIIDMGPFNPFTIYRAGNEVSLSDDSEWLYINDTPSAGHYPPSPALADAWWERVRAPDMPDHVYDPMVYATTVLFDAAWKDVGTTGEVAIVATTDTGGSAVQLGNNAAPDLAQYAYRQLVPYSPEDLYQVTFDLEVLNASAGVVQYLGVQCLDAAGNNLATDVGGYAYVALQAVSTGLVRKTYAGYFRGTAAVGAGNGVGVQSNDPANPCPLPSGTVAIKPIFQVNYKTGGGDQGKAIVHEMSLRKVADITVNPTGDWLSTKTYFKNDGVAYQGRYFGSKQDNNTNHAPPGTATSDAWWFLISDKGSDGAGSFHLVNQAGCTLLSGNSFTKAAGVNGTYDAAVRSVESYIGCVATFAFGQNNLKAMAGLSASPTSSNGIADMYGWQGDAAGNAQPYVLGTVVPGVSLAYTAASAFQVSYNPITGQLAFTKDAVVQYQTTIATGLALFFKSSLAGTAAIVNSLAFGPMVAGANAPLLRVRLSTQQFNFAADGVTPQTTGQSVDINVDLLNLTGTPTVTAALYNGTTFLGNATLTGSGTTYNLTIGNFGTTATKAIVTASLGGQTDTESVIKLIQGSSAINALLTNQNIGLQADAAGNVGSFSGAAGVFELFLGTALINPGFITFSRQSFTAGLTTNINTSGNYSITGLTAAVNQAQAVFRAAYNSQNYDLTMFVTKSPAGATGSNGVGTVPVTLTAPGLTFNGTTFDQPNTGGGFTQGAYTAVISGACQVTFQVLSTYSGAEDFFVALDAAPGPTFAYTNLDYAMRIAPGTNTGVSTNSYEAWSSGTNQANGGTNGHVDSNTYGLRYDGVNNIVLTKTNAAGVVSTLWTYTGIGANKAFGVILAIGQKCRITNFGFGASGKDGSGGSGGNTTPSSTFNGVSTGTFPGPGGQALGAGKTATLHMTGNATWSGTGTGNRTVTVQLQYRINGGGWVAGSSNTQTVNTIVDGSFDFQTTYTNGGSVPVQIEVQAVVTQGATGVAWFWNSTVLSIG